MVVISELQKKEEGKRRHEEEKGGNGQLGFGSEEICVCV
jgi:hypothetical protein